MEARATGQSGWTDPHYAGSYSMLNKDDTSMLVLRKSGSNDGRGGGRYQDKVLFSFSDATNGGCSVGACSDSQGASNNDQSTNYCNIRNLYCGSADGCIVVQNDLTPTEGLGLCPRHDKARCIASTAFSQSVKVGAPATWKDCGSQGAKISDIKFTPNPPVKGNNNLIDGSGTATKDFTAGTASLKLTLNGLVIGNGKFDACKPYSQKLPLGAGTVTYDGIKCPVKAGEQVEIAIHADIKSSSPGGNLVAEVIATTDDGNKAICVDTMFKL
jgi:hypothetical protein